MNAQIIDKLEYHYKDDSQEMVFFKMPKILFFSDEFKEISMSAKLLYMLLLDRVSISIKNNWVDEDDKVFIYYTQEEAMKKLNFGNKKVSSLFKELDENGVITRIKNGFNKPDLIYVKTLATLEVNDTSFDGEYKYSRPNIKHKIDEKSDEVIQLENKVRELEKVIKALNLTIEEINVENFDENPVENSVENSTSLANSTKTDVENFVKKPVENFVENYNKQLNNDKTCQKDTTIDVKPTSPDLSKQQPNNNNTNKNNNINNNSSFNQASTKKIKNDDKEVNDGMTNKQFNFDIIKQMYDSEKIPFSFTDNVSKMDIAVKELVNYDTIQSNFENKIVDKSYFSMYKLFTQALINMLTNKDDMLLNKQNVNYTKVYDNLCQYVTFAENNLGEQFCHLNDLVDKSIRDYQKGSACTEIKYPKKYMQACIWNILEIGDVSAVSAVSNVSDVSDVQAKYDDKTNSVDVLSNTTYDLKKMDDLWNNFVPRLV